jgi:hypothetical protein
MGIFASALTELSKGHLRVTGRVDSEALRTVLERLLG